MMASGNDELRHGPWDKSQQRYEDGSKSHPCGDRCAEWPGFAEEAAAHLWKALPPEVPIYLREPE